MLTLFLHRDLFDYLLSYLIQEIIISERKKATSVDRFNSFEISIFLAVFSWQSHHYKSRSRTRASRSAGRTSRPSEGGSSTQGDILRILCFFPAGYRVASAVARNYGMHYLQDPKCRRPYPSVVLVSSSPSRYLYRYRLSLRSRVSTWTNGRKNSTSGGREREIEREGPLQTLRSSRRTFGGTARTQGTRG